MHYFTTSVGDCGYKVTLCMHRYFAPFAAYFTLCISVPFYQHTLVLPDIECNKHYCSQYYFIFTKTPLLNIYSHSNATSAILGLLVGCFIWSGSFSMATLVTFIATPSGRFLCMYSKNVSAVDPVSLRNCIK